MGLEKLHLKHVSKGGWQLKTAGQRKGELYPTKAAAVKAAEKIAKRSKDGLMVLVDPKPSRRGRTTKAAIGSYAVAMEESVPKQRFRKRNPATPETISLSRMTPSEKATRLREWAAGHSKELSLPDSAFERESFYQDHD